MAWIVLVGQLAFITAWVPEEEMQLAMWQARWSGVRHYGKLPVHINGENPYGFISEDEHLENWQQACIQKNHTHTHTHTLGRNSTRASAQEDAREWWKGMQEKAWNGTGDVFGATAQERPWLNPSCDAYSLGIEDVCYFTWHEPRGQGEDGDAAGFITTDQSRCRLSGPLTARTEPRRNERVYDKFHPTDPTSGPARSVNPFNHYMYICPSTRPLAVWACPKCSSTALQTWMFRMEHEFIIKRASRVLQDARAWTRGSDHYLQLSLARGILEDFPRRINRDELGSVIRKTWIESSPPTVTKGNRTKIGRITKSEDVTIWVPASYCRLCCAWGDGRLKLLIVRNPYVRLMSYYKMKILLQEKSMFIGSSGQFEGWSDFRPWLLALLSHRERTGRFTSTDADNFGGMYCTQTNPACENNSSNPHGPCAMKCIDRRKIISIMDVNHARPIIDILSTSGYDTQDLREGLYQVMHLETMQEDIRDVEKRLCREYGDCEPLPTYPRVFPRIAGRNDKCNFDAKTHTLRNCTVTWEDLWPPSLVELVRLHYAEDFQLFGYKTTPLDIMPIKKDK